MSNIVDKLLETASALNEDAYARYQERKLKEGNKKIDEIDKKIATEERKVEMGKSKDDLKKLQASRDDIQKKHTIHAITDSRGINGRPTSGEITPLGNGKVHRDNFRAGYDIVSDKNPTKYYNGRGTENMKLRTNIPESHTPKNAALHDRINNRSEKYTPKDKRSTQHESAARLAELLVEAANILLETENK